MFQGSTKIRWYPRLGLFKNSTDTVSFDPSTKTGRSYRWNFLQQVDKVLIFNSYNWSVTTSGHQSAVRSVLRERGLKYISVDLGSIEPRNVSKETVKKLYRELFDLEIEIELATKKDSMTQRWRERSAQNLKENIEILIQALPRLKVSQKDLKTIHSEAVGSAMNEVSEKYCDRCFKALSIDTAKNNLNAIEL